MRIQFTIVTSKLIPTDLHPSFKTKESSLFFSGRERVQSKWPRCFSNSIEFKVGILAVNNSQLPFVSTGEMQTLKRVGNIHILRVYTY